MYCMEWSELKGHMTHVHLRLVVVLIALSASRWSAGPSLVKSSVISLFSSVPLLSLLCGGSERSQTGSRDGL